MMRRATDPRRRNRLVLVEARTKASDSSGEETYTWGPAWRDAAEAPIFLNAEKLEGKALERFAAAQNIAITAVVFKFAWAPANQIDPAKHRLSYDGRTLDIHGAVEIGHREGVAVWSAAVAAAPVGDGGPS